MLKILVLAASGMAGHTIVKYLKSLNKYEIKTTARDSKLIEPDYKLDFSQLSDIEALRGIVLTEKFDYLINCVGLLVKASEEDIELAQEINGCFPHFLEYITVKPKTRVIHLSTDCVFSGEGSGWYKDTDTPDGTGAYAVTKREGEINNKKDLTIRMSIIGDELKSNGTGLFNWFLNQSGEVKGYTKVFWNGVTTLELAKRLEELMLSNITGLYQLAPMFSISKFELLFFIQQLWLKSDIKLIPCDELVQNKTLLCSKPIKYGQKIPCYKKQLEELRYFMENTSE
ncbi:hypothetical protein LCGC14_0306140 [marine sediment metagenome]|uniref:RmlD-like substrate binding domain-containing protein n=1 Tax=marine sediment metagenome TaxID=412755 RepID=A0A0F9TP10_9ZZZZ